MTGKEFLESTGDTLSHNQRNLHIIHEEMMWMSDLTVEQRMSAEAAMTTLIQIAEEIDKEAN